MASSETLRTVIDAGRSSKRLDELSSARVIGKVAMQAHAAQQKAGAGKSIGPITPAHIALLPSGETKLEAAGSGSVLGYSAPEQITGSAGDRRSDIFSLGAVLWEALTYTRLFDAMNDAAVRIAVQERDITPPADINANVPAELSAICMRALARNPAERYQSLKVMAVEIEEFLEEAGYADDDSRIAQHLKSMRLPGVTKTSPMTETAPSPPATSTQPMPMIAPAPAAAPAPIAAAPAAAVKPATAAPPTTTPVGTKPPPMSGMSPTAFSKPATTPPPTNGAKDKEKAATLLGIPPGPAPEDWQDKKAPVMTPMAPVLPGDKPEAQAQAKTDAKTEAKTDAKTDARPGGTTNAPKTDAAKAEAKTDAKADARPGGTTNAPKTEAVAPKTDAAKPDAATVDAKHVDPKQTLPGTPPIDDKASTLVDAAPPAMLVDALKADAPKADAPKADAPKADAPKADAPKADAPKADAPKAAAPKADAKARAKGDTKPPAILGDAPPSDAKPDGKPEGKTDAKSDRTGKNTMPKAADVVSLPGRESKGDLLAGWGWGTGKHDALPPAGYAEDSDDIYEQPPSSKKTLTYVIGGGLAVAFLIVVVAFAAGGSKKKTHNAKSGAQTASVAKTGTDNSANDKPTSAETPAVASGATGSAAAGSAQVDPAAAAKAAADQAAADKAAADKAAADKAAADKAAADQAVADKAAADKAAKEQAAADKAAAAKAAKDQAAADKAAKEQAAADKKEQARQEKQAKEEAAKQARIAKEEAAKQAKADKAKTGDKTASEKTRPKTEPKKTDKTVAAADTTQKVDVEQTYRIGLQQFARGDTTGALASLRSALAGNPNYAPTWRGLGLVFEKMGEKSQAKAAYKRYLQLSPTAGDAEIIRGRLERLGT